MNNFRFGIVTDYYGVKISIEKALKHLVKAGIKDIEIPGGHLVKDISNPPSINTLKPKLKNIQKLISDLGMTIWQIHGPYGGNDLVSNSERVRCKNIDVYRRWIDYCCVLNAKSLIIHIGGRNDFCKKSKDIKFIKEKNIDSLFQLKEYIKNENLFLAIENLISRCMETPNAYNLYGNRISDLKDIIKELKSDKIGICLDTGHANVENMDIPLSIKEIGKDLVATHIQENNGIYDMHMFPFSLRPKFSKMNWFSIFKAFKEINYQNPLIGECANSSGELPIYLLDIYLKNQKEFIENVLKNL